MKQYTEVEQCYIKSTCLVKNRIDKRTKDSNIHSTVINEMHEDERNLLITNDKLEKICAE